MKRVRRPDPLLVFPLIAVALQAIQTAFAAIGINPGPIKDTTHRIDAILLVMGRHNLRLYPQGPQRLDPRHGRVQFARFHVMREPMLAIFPSVFEPLFVQHVDIVAQWRARAFVVVDEVIIAANLLNESYRGRITDTQVPRCVYGNAWLYLQRTDTPFGLYVLQRIRVHGTEDGRVKLAEIFLPKERIALDLAIELHPLPMVDGEPFVGHHVGIIDSGNQGETMVRFR